MLNRLAPPFSARRLALQLVRHSVKNPRRSLYRMNLTNMAAWRQFNRTEIRCNICGHVGRLLYEMPDLELFAYHRIGVLRETLRCSGCHSKMRDRTMAAGLLAILKRDFGVAAEKLDDVVPELPLDLRILETDAHSRISQRLASFPGLTRSLYLSDSAHGERIDSSGTRNVNLERMPFADGEFNIILTSEVMEHVRFVERAHRELARCLSYGGTYLFTVPYDPRLDATWSLIDPVTEESLVSRPHIHGDPTLRKEGIKSYRVFGNDIFEAMTDVGLTCSFSLIEDARAGIFAGDLFQAIRGKTP